MEVHTTTRMKPARVCIYCGSTGDLTQEHVVPFGLGGRLVIPEASCKACSKITSVFEGQVLRGFMLAARTAGQFQTRHPRGRPRALPIQFECDGKLKTVDLPANQACGFLHLPILEPPSILRNKGRMTGSNICGSETLVFGMSPQLVASALGSKTIQTTSNIGIGAFVRMLAKIGYAFAVGHYGPYPLPEVPVLPLILESNNDAGTWVGSSEYELAIEEKRPLHALGLRTMQSETHEIIVAQVKLFANTGATGYEVVVRVRER